MAYDRILRRVTLMGLNLVRRFQNAFRVVALKSRLSENQHKRTVLQNASHMYLRIRRCTWRRWRRRPGSRPQSPRRRCQSAPETCNIKFISNNCELHHGVKSREILVTSMSACVYANLPSLRLKKQKQQITPTIALYSRSSHHAVQKSVFCKRENICSNSK